MPAPAHRARARRARPGRPPSVTCPVRGLEAGERAQELALAVALDAGEPDDLARLDVERDVVEAAAAQALDVEQRRGRLDLARASPGRPGRRTRPMIRRRISPSETSAAANVPRVSPSRSTVIRSAIRLHLRQAVRDVDDRGARARGSRGCCSNSRSLSALRQRLGRLVEHEHLRRRARAPWRSRAAGGRRCSAR